MHGAIVVPMALHAMFTTLVVLWDQHHKGFMIATSTVSNSIVGSLSIVVGLMLVSEITGLSCYLNIKKL